MPPMRGKATLRRSIPKIWDPCEVAMPYGPPPNLCDLIKSPPNSGQLVKIFVFMFWFIPHPNSVAHLKVKDSTFDNTCGGKFTTFIARDWKGYSGVGVKNFWSPDVVPLEVCVCNMHRIKRRHLESYP